MGGRDRCYLLYPDQDEENNEKAIGQVCEERKQTAVSPNSFMITAIRYPCLSVKMRLQKKRGGQLVNEFF